MRRLFLVGTAVGGLALFVCSLYATGIRQILGTLEHLGWGFIGILAMSGAREIARAVAWTITIEGPTELGFGDAFRARLAGEALNTLLPMGMLAGEPAKADHVSHRLPFATAFRTLAIEFAWYSASLPVLFAAGLLALFPVSTVLPAAALAVIAVAVIANSIHLKSVGDSANSSENIVRSPLTYAIRKVRTLAEPVFGLMSRHPARAWSIVALEITYHVLAVAEVYLTLVLLSPQHVRWTSALILEGVNRAVTMVFKILPMRMGVDEAGTAMFASRLDLGATTGIMLALIRKTRLLFWSAIGLVFLFTRPTSASLSPLRRSPAAARQ